MKTVHDLSGLAWTLTGYNPNYHLLEGSWEFPEPIVRFTEPVPVRVPGSVQAALRTAGLLPDWNIGRNALLAEWIENRDWAFQTTLPRAWFETGDRVTLNCEGLDFAGLIKLDGRVIAAFADGNVPHRFELAPAPAGTGDVTLEIVFQASALPRWLGQIGHTSRIREPKTRFYYTWDWCPRIVQIGIWDRITVEIARGAHFTDFSCYAELSDPTADRGTIRFRGCAADAGDARLRLRLLAGETVLAERTQPAAALGNEFQAWSDLPVARWWPNRSGVPQRYTFEAALCDAHGAALDVARRTVGFRSIVWQLCLGAAAEADPWLCVVNGEPIFLWGVNWVPTLPNHADETPERVRQLLSHYRDMGCNAVRLNGCGVLGKESFYEICDELGLLVWQDFTMSSSYIDNAPPDDPATVAAFVQQAESIIARRQHHPSLMLWCGGNELYAAGRDSHGRPQPRPVDVHHPMIRALAEVVRRRDPTRRFLPTSASGPLATATSEDLGTGRAWDVHGPWSLVGDEAGTRDYWRKDDALFRSEVGFQGASDAALIRTYAGSLSPLPIAKSNDLYKTCAWWIDTARFVAQHGRAPATIEEYCDWSQDRQAEWLLLAVSTARQRFPRCGGVLLWMGHDCFPCPINTSVIDFHGEPKKAARVLGDYMNRISPQAVLGGAPVLAAP